MDLLKIGEWWAFAPEGPMWYRGFAVWPATQGEEFLRPILRKYGVERFVVGHSVTESRQDIKVRLDGRVFLIDTGMLSSHYDGRASALEIRDGTFTAIYPGEREIVFPPLAEALEDPEVSEIVTRFGQKGGNLAPQNVCNETSYAEVRDTGEQVVVTVFLHNVPTRLSCGEDLDPGDLLVDLLVEPGFADELRDRIPIEDPKPDLIARVETLKRKSKQNGDQLTAKIRVRNIGPADAEGPFEISLVVSKDKNLRKNDDVLETWVIPSLGADRSKRLRFRESGLDPLEGKYLFVRVDRRKAVAESNERNNKRPWQTIP